MIAGLLLTAALSAGADPEAPQVAPGATEAHKDALAKYGAAVWNLRRERLLTAARQLEAAAKADPDSVTPQKELARLYAQLGREPEAIRVARKVLDKDPGDHDTAALLARLLFDAGEVKDAVAAAKLVLDSESLPKEPAKAVRLYREVAALCEKAKDFVAAESALRKAIELVADKRAAVVAAAAFTPKEADGEAADCLERLGRVLVKRGKFDPAAQAFESAAKLYGDPKRLNDSASASRLAWNLSGALEGKGDHAAALKQLEAFLKLKPRAPEPYQRLARLLRAAGRDEEVVSALQEYAKREKQPNGKMPNYPLAAVLAAEMARDPNLRRASDELFASITSVTADPTVIAVVVRSHLETGRAIEIVKDLDRSFAALKEKEKGKEKEKPETPQSAAAKAFAAEKARAIADALEHEPKGVADLLVAARDDLKGGMKRASGTYYFIGSLAARHRQLDLAIVQFTQAVRGAPQASRGEAYDALIRVLRLAGRSAEVETLCRDALRTENGFMEVFFNFYLSLALAEQGKAKEAVASADKAIQQAGDDSRLTVRVNKHRVLCVLGKWDEAIEYGQKLIDEFDAPDERPRVRYAQSGAYWGAKKPAEAEKLLRAMLDDDPDSAAACNDLGYHLADQGRNLAEAERLIRHAITVDRIERRKSGSAEGENAAYIDSLGWVLFRQGKLADAKAQLEKAAALASGAVDPTVWDHLGDVLFRLGEKAKAKAAWEKARELYDADGRISSRGRRDGRLDEVKRKLQRVP